MFGRLQRVIERYRDGVPPGTWTSHPPKGGGIHQPPWSLDRRAGCVERCLSGSREAHASKPLARGPRNNLRVLSHGKCPRTGATGKAFGPKGSKVVCDPKQVKILPEGFGLSTGAARSTPLAWDFRAPRGAGPGLSLWPGDRTKRPPEKSSTMKGAKP